MLLPVRHLPIRQAIRCRSLPLPFLLSLLFNLLLSLLNLLPSLLLNLPQLQPSLQLSPLLLSILSLPLP